MVRQKRHLTGIFGAVGLISLLTLLSRLVGFLRWLSQSAWVGTGAFASAYSTANQIPTVLFEVVAGGALAGITIPLLAGPIASKNQARINQTTSALLCWALVLLVPVGLIVFLTAPLIAQLMPSPLGADRSLQITWITTFLRVFSIQVPLYGICVVLTGVCQAHERFLLPALAPLMSSLVVISSYAIFGCLVPQISDPHTLTEQAIALLAWGTTAGVGALSLPLFFPVFRLGIKLRFTLALGKESARQALRLGLAGIGALIAQQVSVITVMVVIRAYGAPGSLPIYQYSQAVYTLPYAVLAVPVATAVFPRLSALLQENVVGEDTKYPERFARECALSTKIVTLVGILGGALLIAQAPLVTAIFHRINEVPGMMLCLIWMGPGIIGYGLIYHVCRVLYALHGAKEAVVGASSGWIVVSFAAWGLAHLLVGEDGLHRGEQIMVAIGLAQSLGMTVSGVALLWFLYRIVGPAALKGLLVPSLICLLDGVLAGVLGCYMAQSLLQIGSSVLLIFCWAALIAVFCLLLFSPVFVWEVHKYRRQKPVAS